MDEREMSKMGIAMAIFAPMTPTAIISKVPIEDMSDLNRLKVRAWDAATSNIVKALNGEPIVMVASEYYLAIQRGVVDAVLTGVPGMLANAIHEQAKHLYVLGLAPACLQVGYNIEKFEALPEDWQQILIEEWDILAKKLYDAQPRADGESLDKMRDFGVTVNELPADQKARMVERVMPLWEEWADAGDTNREAYDAALKAMGY